MNTPNQRLLTTATLADIGNPDLVLHNLIQTVNQTLADNAYALSSKPLIWVLALASNVKSALDTSWAHGKVKFPGTLGKECAYVCGLRVEEDASLPPNTAQVITRDPLGGLNLHPNKPAPPQKGDYTDASNWNATLNQQHP